VLISRCAWHRRYHGYTKVLGISAWRGLNVSFTDGICHKCAARVRADHLRARFDRGASADRRETPWLPGLAAVSLAVMVSLVLIARPTHELPPVPPVIALLPPAAEPPAVVHSPAAMSSRAIVKAAPAPRVAAAPRLATHRASAQVARSMSRTLVVAPARLTWPDPAMLTRGVVLVSSTHPYRVPPRDALQSP
jgi:hypothetical protein